MHSPVDPLARDAEKAKYERAYANPDYHLRGQRWEWATRDLLALPRGSYLDVGCGRGEMLRFARSFGFEPCMGLEAIVKLERPDVVIGEAHALPFPDKSFDVVSMFDVIEHLLPGDDEAACRELARVARAHVLLTANNNSSMLEDGTELHVNRRAYKEWHALFTEWFAPGRVTWLRPMQVLHLNTSLFASQTWRVDF